jgi:hypothetical protein
MTCVGQRVCRSRRGTAGQRFMTSCERSRDKPLNGTSGQAFRWAPDRPSKPCNPSSDDIAESPTSPRKRPSQPAPAIPFGSCECGKLAQKLSAFERNPTVAEAKPAPAPELPRRPTGRSHAGGRGRSARPHLGQFGNRTGAIEEGVAFVAAARVPVVMLFHTLRCPRRTWQEGCSKKKWPWTQVNVLFASSRLGLVRVIQGTKTIGALLQVVVVFERSFAQRGHSLASAAPLKQRADHKR